MVVLSIYSVIIYGNIEIPCLSGTIYAIDINKGRLRILKEATKLHEVNHIITTIHADLRAFAVRNSLTRSSGIILKKKELKLSHPMLPPIRTIMM